MWTKHTTWDAINIERLGRANIPVPTVVAQGEEPVSYIILNWIEGWLDVALPWWGEQEGVSAQMVDTAWQGFEALRPLLATRGQHYMLYDG